MFRRFYKKRVGDALLRVSIFGDIQSNTLLLKEPGVYCFLLRCKRPEAESFLKWVVETVLPREVRALKEQIEERDAQLALLNDDLQEREHDIGLLKEELVIERRKILKLMDDYKNPGIAVIHKNNGDDFPYIAICGQQGYVGQKIRNKLADFPNGQLVVFAGTPNAIIQYNWLREHELIVVNPNRTRHFRLGDNYTHQQLEELQE